MTAITRRELIAGAGALALAVPVRGQARPDADVIVVGAGVSGLNAAWLLEQQGARVIVLEGRKRVGGRVFTLFDEPGYPEMGFNNMAPGYGRSIDAARRAGVELVDQSPRFRFAGQQELVLGGRFIPRAAWAADPANPLPPALRTAMPWEVINRVVGANNPLKSWSEWYEPANRVHDISMNAFLRAQGLSDAAIQLVFDTVPYHGTTSYDVSALMYEYSDGWTKDQIAAGTQAFSVKDGNMHLPVAMAKLLKGGVELEREVIGVDAQAQVATVTCRDGRRYTAKHVILALPFSMVRQIRITPALAGAQAEAVRMLPYQAISILFLRVSAPFWDEDRLAPGMWTDGIAGWVTAQRFGRTPEEVTGIMVQARGQLAHVWERMGAEAAKQAVVAEIERLRPAARGKLHATYLQSWTTDRFNGGDWSYLAPGQARLIADMAKPSGRIHFAGEHTAPLNRGLEAAFDSSERVAIEVAEQL